ncbi:hypothetical protein DDT91_00405 [Algoriphagus sp. AK58]|nr:hypothetical protein [Algoriphagus sp. AK58]
MDFLTADKRSEWAKVISLSKGFIPKKSSSNYLELQTIKAFHFREIAYFLKIIITSLFPIFP